jgi:hypothetical protein
VEGAREGRTLFPGFSSIIGSHAGLCRRGQGPKTVEAAISNIIFVFSSVCLYRRREDER